MPLFRQLELDLTPEQHLPGQVSERTPENASVRTGSDPVLETRAKALLGNVHAAPLAEKVRVNWSGRLRTAAGRADSRRMLITLNPLLQRVSDAEIDRTLRHELAHLLAQWRVGRRRIEPHGPEWRQACRDLAIPGEARCHSLPFPVRRQPRKYLYVCPACDAQFPRVKPFRRRRACLSCCRRHNGGAFHPNFQLVRTVKPSHIARLTLNPFSP